MERIRTDEAVHVGYLQVLISELRGFTWRTVGGGEASGAEILDPVWAKMIEWHGRTERELAARRTRAALERQIIAAKGEAGGRGLLARLDAMDARAAA